GKEEVHFTPHYTLFCLLNDIPKIEPMDKAILNRLTYIEFPYEFVDKEKKDKRPYYREKNVNLDENIKSEKFIYGFIHILLDAYQDYLENGLPEFDETIKKKWTADQEQNTEIVDLISEYYEVTGNENDQITKNEMAKFKETHKLSISLKLFNSILEE